MQLRDTELFRQRGLIGEEWRDAKSGKTVDVINPATQSVLGTVPDMGVAETRDAIEAASRRSRSGRRRPTRNGRRFLRHGTPSCSSTRRISPIS